LHAPATAKTANYFDCLALDNDSDDTTDDARDSLPPAPPDSSKIESALPAIWSPSVSPTTVCGEGVLLSGEPGHTVRPSVPNNFNPQPAHSDSACRPNVELIN
jgi:hypothetical protein